MGTSNNESISRELSPNTIRRNVAMCQPGGVGTPAQYLTAGDCLFAMREKKEAWKK